MDSSGLLREKQDFLALARSLDFWSKGDQESQNASPKQSNWMAGKSVAERKETATCYVFSSQTGKEPKDGPILQVGWERLRGEVRPTWAEPTGNNRSRMDMLMGSSGHRCKGHHYLKPGEDCIVRSHPSQGFGAYRSPEKHHGKGWAVYRTAQECSQGERKKYKDFLVQKARFQSRAQPGRYISKHLPTPRDPIQAFLPTKEPYLCTPCRSYPTSWSWSPRLRFQTLCPCTGAFTWVTGWLRHTGSGLQGLNPGSAPN